jgi:hypothetical protein
MLFLRSFPGGNHFDVLAVGAMTAKIIFTEALEIIEKGNFFYDLGGNKLSKLKLFSAGYFVRQ